MDSDKLSLLEQKIEQFLVYCNGLRTENQSLRGRVTELEHECQRLTNKIDIASTRLEALMSRLPGE